MGLIRKHLKELILWALGDEYPKIITTEIVRPVETLVIEKHVKTELDPDDGLVAPHIDIRVPKKLRR